MVQKKIRRIEIMIPVESYIIIATRMAILEIPALNQKTSVGLDNLYAGD